MKRDGKRTRHTAKLVPQIREKVVAERGDSIEKRIEVPAALVQNLLRVAPDSRRIQGQAVRVLPGGEPWRGSRIAELREAADLTVADLAAKSYLPAKLIEEYESSAPTDAGHRRAIAAALDASETALFPPDAPTPGTPPPETTMDVKPGRRQRGTVEKLEDVQRRLSRLKR